MKVAFRIPPSPAVVLTTVLAAGAATAEETAPATSAGDTAWVLTSAALVLMMTVPGLALFYGGLVRAKNILSLLMQCLTCLALVSVLWVVAGYSIAFGDDIGGGLLGDPVQYLGLRGIDASSASGSIPTYAFLVFQLMFAAITPALITGAFAERMRFGAFVLFTALWSLLIYSPLCHWVWGPDGWLGARGAMDFAGGTVVHISSGTAALVAALLVGARRGFGREPMPPHNLPFTLAGAALLWVGWFGFNAGSALAADGAAALAFVTTNTAAAAAALSWAVAEWLGRAGRPTLLGAATGAVAGLVAITPAAGFVAPWAALVIGAVAGVLCQRACTLKTRLGYDDALDVVGVHGVGGTWGALATGIFALEGGLVAGAGLGQLGEQALGVLATYAFAGIGTWLILLFVRSVTPLRVEAEEEEMGLDLTEHSETAYATGPVGGHPVAAPSLATAPAEATAGAHRTREV